MMPEACGDRVGDIELEGTGVTVGVCETCAEGVIDLTGVGEFVGAWVTD